MSATVSGSRLKEAAAWASRSIASRPSVPVMGAAVLAVEDGALTVSGWDWDTFTRYTCDAEGDLERTLVGGKLLATIASKSSSEVRLEREGSQLVLRSGRARSALNTMAGEEYPELPKPYDEAGVTDDLAGIVARVAPSAAGADAPNTWMHGVSLSAADGELTALATDRYVLSLSSAAWTGADFTVNIPSRRLHEVARHMDGKVTLGVSENGISMDASGVYASIIATDAANGRLDRLLDPGQFTGGSVDVDREALIRAIDNVTPTVGDKNPIRLYISSGEIVLKSADQGIGESDDALDCRADFSGDGFAMGISPAYLTKALDATPAEVVRVLLGSSAKKPVLVHGLVDGEPDLSTRHVVMPIRTNDL